MTSRMPGMPPFPLRPSSELADALEDFYQAGDRLAAHAAYITDLLTPGKGAKGDLTYTVGTAGGQAYAITFEVTITPVSEVLTRDNTTAARD